MKKLILMLNSNVSSTLVCKQLLKLPPATLTNSSLESDINLHLFKHTAKKQIIKYPTIPLKLMI